MQCIHELRAALGDTTQRLIRNVPRRGYLLASEVTPEETLPRAGPAGARGDAVDPHPPGAPSRAAVDVRQARLRVAAAALMGLLAAVVAVATIRPDNRATNASTGSTNARSTLRIAQSLALSRDWWP